MILEKNDHLLSVVIPVYRQEKSIYKDLIRIKKILDEIRYDYEIIVVIDGRIDNSEQEAKNTKDKKIKVIGYDNNHGKGYAVRFGMARTKGDYVAFIDSGMDLNPQGLIMALEHLEWYNADIIVGSKRHPVSKVYYPLHRRFISFVYQIIIHLLFGFKVTDTQVGLKIYRRVVLEKVLPRLLVKQFAFDVEILAVAYRLGFKRIFEAPVELDFTGTSSISSITTMGFWKLILKTLWDTLAIFYRLKILHYYDDHNQRKWRYDEDLAMRINIG